MKRSTGSLNKHEAAAVRRVLDGFGGELAGAAADPAFLAVLASARRKMGDTGAVRFVRRRAAVAPGPAVDADAARAAKWGPEGRG